MTLSIAEWAYWDPLKRKAVGSPVIKIITIEPHGYCMDLCSQSCSAGLVQRKLWCWTLCVSFSPNSFIPAMLIATIDFHRFMPLSVTLTVALGSQDQRKTKPVGFYFLAHFYDQWNEI